MSKSSIDKNSVNSEMKETYERNRIPDREEEHVDQYHGHHSSYYY